MSERAAYLVAILGLSAIGVAGMIVLEKIRPDVDRGLILQMFGFLAPTLLGLLALLRGVSNGTQIAEVKETIKPAVQRFEKAADKTEIAADHMHAIADTISKEAPPKMPIHNLPTGSKP